jgi:hypothetical protein
VSKGREIPVVFADGARGRASVEEEVFVMWFCRCGAEKPLVASSLLEPEVACECGRRYWIVFERGSGRPSEVHERTGETGSARSSP